MGVRPQRFMSGLPRAAIALGVMAVTALCAFSSCLAAEPGVTDKTVKIGILGSLTGPFAIFGTGNLSGATIAFEEANAAGGINGRKIEWISLDDESSPPKGIAAYKRLVEQEKVFAVFGPAASAVGQALVPTLKASKTPTFVSVFSTPAVTDPMIPILFRTGPMNDRQQGSAMADYVRRPLNEEDRADQPVRRIRKAGCGKRHQPDGRAQGDRFRAARCSTFRTPISRLSCRASIRQARTC